MGGRPKSYALALGGAFALCASVALAGSGAGEKPSLKRRTISSGDIDLQVPGASVSAPGTRVTRIAVGRKLKGLGIRDVDVALRASHADVGAFQATLTAPNGASVSLVLPGYTSGPSWGSGQAGCGGKKLVLDDQTSRGLSPFDPIVGGLELGPPYNGRAQPARKPLFSMNGGPASGRWTLRMSNYFNDELGTLHCLELRIKPQIPPG
ncbi:MAG: hypothetical protein EXQ70_04695 [Solirubrobacterales bacterium]|nr:hypothetical protein [Solirubrobacterales bacterium]